MAKTIPTTYVDPSAANLSRGEIILAADLGAIVEAQHYHFAHRGARLRGVVFDTPWDTTTSASYVVDPDTSTARKLDTISCVSLPLRELSSGNVRYQVSAYGENYDLRCTVRRLDTGATVTTIAVDGAGGPHWQSTQTTLTLSTYAAIPLEFTFEARWTTDGTEATIFQIELHEHVLTATSDLPTS